MELGCGLPISFRSSILILLYRESLPAPHLCYHRWLVKIALGISRQFDGLMQKVHFYTGCYKCSYLFIPVRTFIILIMVKSPGFGSNFRYLSLFNNWFIWAFLLASEINLLTHYAKGTLFLLFNIIRAAYKTTISICSLSVLIAIAYMSYLALEEGSPIFKQF